MLMFTKFPLFIQPASMQTFAHSRLTQGAAQATKTAGSLACIWSLKVNYV